MEKTDKSLVYYGPHACAKCDPKGLKKTLIVKAGNGAPDNLEFDYPASADAVKTDGSFPYPNTHPELIWNQHQCSPEQAQAGAALGGGAFVAPTTLEDKLRSIRSLALSWEKSILALRDCPELKLDLSDTTKPQGVATSQNPGEAISNIMLAYRHIEDARMRLGKAIQAMDGGVSVYDKKA